MDKYHIYEEVGSGQHSQVFKGREKMDIEYVAIKRVEKSRMENVVREVQVIHRLSSPNVLKFYDWYETRNNVWLILEFCTGGDLLTLIKQDHREPESAVRLFGVDLLAGLQQTHACGYVHGDLRPSNVLIDEYGILKLSGFGLARSVSSKEDEEERSQQGGGHRGHGAGDSGAGAGVLAEGRDPTYMAPELLSVGEEAMSFASDFWSLGCVLYELLIGEPPFRSSASATVAEKIANERPPGLDRREWQGAPMSTHFRDLVSRLLEKDPRRRPTWPQLLAHPFWGSCQTPSPLEMPPQPRFDSRQGAVDSITAAANVAVRTKSPATAAVAAARLDDAAAAATGAGDAAVWKASTPHQLQQSEGGGGGEGVGGGGGSGGGGSDDGSGARGDVESTPSSLSSPSSSLSASGGGGGLASISTIDSSSTRRRKRRGVTGELDRSFAPTAKLLGEIPEAIPGPHVEGQGVGTLAVEDDAADDDVNDFNRGRAWEGAANSGGAEARAALDVASINADSFSRHTLGQEEEVREERREGSRGRDKGPIRVPPSPPRTISRESAATERWRPVHQQQHCRPQDQQPPRGPRSDRDRDDDDDRLVDEAPDGNGWGEMGAAVTAAAAAFGQKLSIERQVAPSHDGLILCRGERGGGESSAIGKTANATTAVADSKSSVAVSRRSDGGALENANDDAVSTPPSAAKRAAAAEALNGLRLRGRIPPVRHAVGAGAGRGGGRRMGSAPGAGERGGGGGNGWRAGSRTSPSRLSVVSVVSSSVGEQYGSSFEEDTESNSSCSITRGGCGGYRGWGSEQVESAPAVVASERRTKTNIMAGGGGSNSTQIAGCFVLTPGSVGTKATATPSSEGVASSTRGGREYSIGGGDGGGQEVRDRKGDTSRSAGSSASVGSGSSAAAISATAATADAGRTGSLQGIDFAMAALSFRKAAGCCSSSSLASASERASTSSWALPAGVSSPRGAQEMINWARDAARGDGRAFLERAPGSPQGANAKAAVAEVGDHGWRPPVREAATTTVAAGGDGAEHDVDETGAWRGSGIEERRQAARSPAEARRGTWSEEARSGAAPSSPSTPPQAAMGQAGTPADAGHDGRHAFAEGPLGKGRGVGVSVPRGERRDASVSGGGQPVDETGGGGGDVARSPVRPRRRRLRRDLRDLLLHTSDAQVTPIVGSRSINGDVTAAAGGGASSADNRCRQSTSRSSSSTSSSSSYSSPSYSSSRVDQLPFEALHPAAVSAMPPPRLEAHLTAAYNALTEASGPVRQKGQTLLYLQSLAPIPRVANLLVNSTFLALLLRLLRKPRPAAIRETAATLIGMLVRYATFIAPGAGREPPGRQSAYGSRGGGLAGGGMREAHRPGTTPVAGAGGMGSDGGLMSALIFTAGARPPPGRSVHAAVLRRNAVAALGELLFYVVTQEPIAMPPASALQGGDGGCSDAEAWSIPVEEVGVVIGKCLLSADGDAGGGGLGVQHYAAKTLENVLAQAGPSHPLVSVLVTPEMALGLLNLARHAASETLRGTAAAGLSHLLGHDVLGGECGEDSFNEASSSSSGGGGGGGDGSSSCSSQNGMPFSTYGRRPGGASQCAARPGRRSRGRRRANDGWHDSDEDGGGGGGGGGGGKCSPGWITSRVMSEPGAPEAIMEGLLAQGTSAASRKAFLGIFNLVLWASMNCSDEAGSGGGGGGRGWPADREEPCFAAAAGGGAGGVRPSPHLRRTVERILDSPGLLLGLLRLAEHAEGTVLRAKGFLALRLALEAAGPAFLLRACRSRLLPLLARAIGGLAPRSSTAARGPAGATAAAFAAAATAVPVPELSPQQEYLYECATTLADWLCAVPQTATRRLVTELRKPRAISAGGCVALAGPGRGFREKHRQQSVGRGGGSRGGGSRQFANTERTVAEAAAGGAAGTGALETALAMFPAVVHLVNSPLLRGRAVTAAFVTDLADCLALSCPRVVDTDGEGTTAGMSTGIQQGEGGSCGGREPASASAPAAGSLPEVVDGAAATVVLAAILPTVETLAQQAEMVLLPHRRAVSSELIPVLCRLLQSHSGDTRALVMAVFRVLLPPLLRQQRSSSSGGDSCNRTAVASAATEERSSKDFVRSALSAHLLPLTGRLLRDFPPIPQYAIRLLLDVAQQWRGLGPALLAGGGGVLHSLLGRLPRPLPTPLLQPPPRGQSSVAHVRPAAVVVASAALDPALAALLTLLVERDEFRVTESCSSATGRPEPGDGDKFGGGAGCHNDGGSGYDDDRGGGSVFERLVEGELPGRTAAAVAAAVEAGSEAADAFLGLAVALTDAGLRRKAAAATWGHEQQQQQQLEPLLAAVPSAVKGLTLFGVESVSTDRRYGQEPLPGPPTRAHEGGGGAVGTVDGGVRSSGVSDSATLFLEACHKIFGDTLLRALLFSGSTEGTMIEAAGGGGGVVSPAPTRAALAPALGTGTSFPSLPGAAAPGVAAAARRATRVCGHLADFLGCCPPPGGEDDDRLRLRVLRLLLAAATATSSLPLGLPSFRSALRQGPLWTALLRLATGRGAGGADSAGRAHRGGSKGVVTAATPEGFGGKAALGPTIALARAVVSALREDRGHYVASTAESRRWSARGGGGGSTLGGEV